MGEEELQLHSGEEVPRQPEKVGARGAITARAARELGDARGVSQAACWKLGAPGRGAAARGGGGRAVLSSGTVDAFAAAETPGGNSV